jgi:hypothetical protein
MNPNYCHYYPSRSKKKQIVYINMYGLSAPSNLCLVKKYVLILYNLLIIKNKKDERYYFLSFIFINN